MKQRDQETVLEELRPGLYTTPRLLNPLRFWRGPSIPILVYAYLAILILSALALDWFAP